MPGPQSFKLPSWASAGAQSPAVTEKRVTTPDGTVHVFPSSVPDEKIASILGLDRTTAGDLLDTGKGFVKGAARTGLDILRPTMGALTMIPQVGSTLNAARNSELLQPENERQQAGMFGFDVGSMVMPSSLASKGARGAELLRPVANRLYRTAVDVGKEGAEQLLERGIGRPTMANARRAYGEVLEHESAHPKVTGNQKIVPSPLRESGASWGLREAAKDQARRMSQWSPLDVMSAGSLKLLKQATGPGARATYAQGLYRAAPALQTAAGAVSPTLALALAKLFSGQPPDGE
jgi:hypothetical protein